MLGSGAASALPASTLISPAEKSKSLHGTFSLPWIGHDIDQRRVAALHDGDRSLERRSELLRIRDRPLPMNSKALCHRGIIHVRIFDRGADTGVFDAASEAGGHRGEVHVLLMVGPIVVHDIEERNAMVRGRP